MASRQDQLHSYQFSVRRVVCALVLREPDAAQTPTRGLAGATLAGVLVAAISLAVVAVYGVLSPGSGGDWTRPGAVIVERDSGARYVYLDGRLHPVLNYASARLIIGTGARTTTVSAKALAGTPRGAPLGISGAPDALPAAGDLLPGAWSVCSAQLGTAGAGTPESVLFVGASPGSGPPLGERGLLAQTPDRTLYLIWHATALRIPRPQLVQAAFSWGGQAPVPVAAALVDAVPAGPDLAPPVIAHEGTVSTRLPDYRIGTVLVSQDQTGTRQYGVVLADGVAFVSQVQADLLLSDPDGTALVGRRSAVVVPQAQWGQVPATSLPGPSVALPATTPQLARPLGGAGAVCAAVPDGAPVQLTLDADMTAARAAVPLGGSAPADPAGGQLADRIVVPPGHGAVVASVASGTAPAAALCLVTDGARRYPLAAPEVAGLLGYPAGAVVRVPSALVALLPAGPVLDPAAARQPSSTD